MTFRHSRNEAREAKRELADRLRNVEGITSIGIGTTESRDDYAVMVTVLDKKSTLQVPDQVDGVPVIVAVTGAIQGY